MIVIFVHGWSVTNTDSYGDLPRWLEAQGKSGALDIEVANIYLSHYISFDDAVTLDDIARAFDQAIRDALASKLQAGQRFACITHSTGGPVVRLWLDLYYKGTLAACPLSHLIMLAPANHGSALAQLGTSRLGRIDSFFEGVEPGQHVLDWLELGSEQSWRLNESWLDYDCKANGVYAFVLTGQTIDRKLYDAINSYTGEPGSDGVVRVASANMNYSLLALTQNGDTLKITKTARPKPMALGILPGRAHAGEERGILRSVTLAGAETHPTAQWVRRCLQVKSALEYDALAVQLSTLSAETQQAERIENVSSLFSTRTYVTNRYSMLVFRLLDDRGNRLNDYDLYLTAGPEYDENELPPGFFIDRQKNSHTPGTLTYFLDYDVMESALNTPGLQNKIGFYIQARPAPGAKALAYYAPLDFRSSLTDFNKMLRPNETAMLAITLQRNIDKSVARMTNTLTPAPIDAAPIGRVVA